MGEWRCKLKYDPIESLLSNKNKAIQYFVKRDLLEENVEPVETLWDLPSATKILQKQQDNGSWKNPGKKVDAK